MLDSTTTTPAPTTPVTKIPRVNALQDKAHANAISSSERSIKAALGSPALLLALAPSGYNEVRFNSGLQLALTGQTTYDARQGAMDVASTTQATLKAAREAARVEFVSYRTVVQTNYEDADRANLGASGRVTNDGDKFITHARSAYSTALTPSHLAKLSEFGFTEERLNTNLANLDALMVLASTADNAVSAAQTATEARNAAVEALNTWMAQLRKIAKDKLKARPDLLSLLKA